MRPIVKVLLVLGVVVLAVGVVWFASRKWTSAPAPAQEAQRPADQRPSYNDPLATLERWRQILPGHPSEQPAPPARRPDRLRSSAEHEGTIVAHRSETPVAGADPPGPVLRPTGVEGEVVTTRWREREPAAGAGNTYTIVQGDTLYGIAMKHYGDPRCAALIESANPGLNARALKVGERILLPERRPPEAAAPAGGTPAAPATPPGKVYVVQRNDTLIGIARRFYGDAAAYKKIYEANKDILSSPNATLPVGQKLRLPER